MNAAMMASNPVRLSMVVGMMVAALSVAGCSSERKAGPAGGGQASGGGGGGGKPKPKPILGCTSSKTGLTLAQLDRVTNAFESKVAARESLSARELDRLYNDRNAKGEIVHHSIAAGPKKDPIDWAHKDLEADKLPGTSTERAYKDLGLKAGTTITVAVIDSGMDITHEDLAANIWTNEAEAKGEAGKDDDGNGYIDDFNGWNYLGGKNGQAVYDTTLELTRELRRMRGKKAAGTPALTPAEETYLAALEKDYTEKRGESEKNLANRTKRRADLQAALDVLKKACRISGNSTEEVEAIQTKDPVIVAAKTAALAELKKGWDLPRFASSVAHWQSTLDFHYNLNFDPSAIVGDKPEQMDEVGYGNGSVIQVGADEDHSTHVAGIIGAVRGNGKGIEGQAANVKLMALRAVPNGDERDKDVANAIRYAADKGARVINMSFGKAYSPNRETVWAAIEYAASKGVLLVHAAGNAAQDNDKESNFPNRYVTAAEGKPVKTLDNVIEVGASTEFPDTGLVADFSNYGQITVDLFAPGERINSTIPGNKYAEFGGTSMASPEVAGIAALILSQKPELTPTEVKKLILDGAAKFAVTDVFMPGIDREAPDALKVPFAKLSVTGALANAFNSLKAAGL